MIHVKLFRVFKKEMQQTKTRFRQGFLDPEVSKEDHILHDLHFQSSNDRFNGIILFLVTAMIESFFWISFVFQETNCTCQSSNVLETGALNHKQNFQLHYSTSHLEISNYFFFLSSIIKKHLKEHICQVRACIEAKDEVISPFSFICSQG